jgi:hypothetical protein
MAMLARQLETDDITEAPQSRLMLVGERQTATVQEESGRARRLAFFGGAIVRISERVRQRPDLSDRLLVLGIIIVVVVSVYVLVFDPS